MTEVGQWFLGLIGSVTMVGLGGVGFIHNKLSKMEAECEEGIDQCEKGIALVQRDCQESNEELRRELLAAIHEKQLQHELILRNLSFIPTREEVRQDRNDMESRIMAAIRKNGNGTP